MRLSLIFAVVSLGLPTIASAAETITYSYDAKGRLSQVAHTGSVNNGVVATYKFDAADNRSSVTVEGAVPRVVVVPLNGITVIPLAN